MPRLFSYVVDHDYGFAPAPSDDFCTLAKCKFKKKRKNNIVELAKEGGWVIGTGGADKKKSAGHGKLIYAMRVDEKLSLTEYYSDERFRGQADSRPDGLDSADRFVLVSRHFFYFGRNAIDIAQIPTEYLNHPLEKKGPGYRSDFSEKFIEDFAKWLERNYKTGIHGAPCGYREESTTPIKKRNSCKQSSCPALSRPPMV